MSKRDVQKGYCPRLLTALGMVLIFLTGCDTSQEIVSNVNQKEANVILVLLESKGIPASKSKSSSGTEIGGEGGDVKYSIVVPAAHAIDAIAYLNQNGFPRQKGSNLLDLFAKQGLMTSDKEETIRYQAGLAEQLNNTILMMDGVIDSTVQLSFPSEDTTIGGEQKQKHITAAIYVKHQGVIDDPNVHLENKIKRLISGSISGLDINDVTVVADRSRFTAITLDQMTTSLSGKPGEYVSIWNIVISKDSLSRFRFLFFLMTTLLVILAVILGWLIWKFYPFLKRKGMLRELLSPIPWMSIKNEASEKSGTSSEEGGSKEE